jgi:Ni,Fe-hydrogenase III large subunit
MGSCVRHLVTSRLDHLPILLDMEHKNGLKHRGRILRYEIMWEREALLSEEIQNSLEASHPVQSLGDVAINLNLLMSSLRWWSKENFRVVIDELEKIRKHMEELGVLIMGQVQMR